MIHDGILVFYWSIFDLGLSFALKNPVVFSAVAWDSGPSDGKPWQDNRWWPSGRWRWSMWRGPSESKAVSTAFTNSAVCHKSLALDGKTTEKSQLVISVPSYYQCNGPGTVWMFRGTLRGPQPNSEQPVAPSDRVFALPLTREGRADPALADYTGPSALSPWLPDDGLNTN